MVTIIVMGCGSSKKAATTTVEKLMADQDDGSSSNKVRREPTSCENMLWCSPTSSDT